MKKFTKLFTVVLISVLLVASLSACGDKGEEAEATTGNDFGPFTSITLTGEDISNSIFEDADVTMLNVWGTVCSPCINEMPDLEKINQKYSSDKFQILGVVSDSAEVNDPKVQQIIDETGVTYRHILNNEGLSGSSLVSVSLIPTTFFVGKDGAILRVEVGAKEYEAWASIIEEVLAQTTEAEAN